MSKKQNHPWKNQQQSNSQVVGITRTQSISYSGPIPPASELERFEKVSPGAANRIIAMAESQIAHRHLLEKTVIESNVANERQGMHYAFILTIVLELSGAVLVYTGKDVVGYFALFGGAVFQAGNYIYHKVSERKVARSSNKTENTSN